MDIGMMGTWHFGLGMALLFGGTLALFIALIFVPELKKQVKIK